MNAAENKNDANTAAITAADTGHNSIVSSPPSGSTTPPPHKSDSATTGIRRSVSNSSLFQQVDLSKQDDLFKQKVQFSSNRVGSARNPLANIQHRLKQTNLMNIQARKAAFRQASPQGSDDSHLEKNSRKQFTVLTKKGNRRKWMFGRINSDDYEFHTNTKFIHWILHESFAVLMVWFTLFFMVLVLAFSPLYILASLKEPKCIMISGETNFNTLSFVDAFTLSWKSLLTAVDVGKASTANSVDFPDDSNCFITSSISTAQFFGSKLLFDGILLSIVITRFMRKVRHSPVKFSDVVCVGYGNFAGETIEETRNRLRCPVLKFQLVNELANSVGGHIVDANLSAVVRKESESYPYEPTARFLLVRLEEESHPYFNRVWHGRHILDENSPLISLHAKAMIRRNEGHWPEELNNPQSIREHLRFNKFTVTMTGLSNTSCECGQTSKSYYHHDVLIGYGFAPLLYEQEGSHGLKVDLSLVNDVVEQKQGGVAEILTRNEVNRPSLLSSRHNSDKKSIKTSRPPH